MVINHDANTASGMNPTVTAAVGTVAIGVGVWYMANKLKVAQRLAADSKEQAAIPEDPEQKSILLVGAVMKQLSDWRQCVWDDERFTDGSNDYIDKWANKNRISRFNYNKYAEEVYRLILCITGHMIVIARMGANIPDYVRPKGKGYCSSMVLAFDLLTWHILEATASEDSPFFVSDDNMKESDIKYMERTIKELSGFLDALRENLSNTHDDGKSGVLTYLEGNDFITVTPLYKMKESAAVRNNDDFVHIATEDEMKYIGDVPNMLVEKFYKRIKKNLEEPCKLSRNYSRRKEILETAGEVKDLIQILKEAGRIVIS